MSLDLKLKVWELRYYKGVEPVLIGQMLPLNSRVTFFLRRNVPFFGPVPNRLLHRRKKLSKMGESLSD